MRLHNFLFDARAVEARQLVGMRVAVVAELVAIARQLRQLLAAGDVGRDVAADDEEGGVDAPAREQLGEARQPAAQDDVGQLARRRAEAVDAVIAAEGIRDRR